MLSVLILSQVSGICRPWPPAEVAKKEEKKSQRPTPPIIVIKGLICAYALENGIEPAFAMAVAHIESRFGGKEFRVGLMGGSRYFGPMGIHRCFKKRWPIDQPETNIKVGCWALRGVGSNVSRQRSRLKRYNASFNCGYWRAVRGAVRKYREEGWDGY